MWDFENLKWVPCKKRLGNTGLHVHGVNDAFTNKI